MPYISLHVDIEWYRNMCSAIVGWTRAAESIFVDTRTRNRSFNWTHVIMHSISIPHIQYLVAYVYDMYIYIYAICIPHDHMYKMYASIYPHPSSNYISKNVEEQTLNLCYVYIYIYYICAYPSPQAKHVGVLPQFRSPRRTRGRTGSFVATPLGRRRSAGVPIVPKGWLQGTS